MLGGIYAVSRAGFESGDKTAAARLGAGISNSGRIFRMGDYGSASVVKIITNMLAGAHMNLAGEATMLAARHDIDLSATDSYI